MTPTYRHRRLRRHRIVQATNALTGRPVVIRRVTVWGWVVRAWERLRGWR